MWTDNWKKAAMFLTRLFK